MVVAEAELERSRRQAEQTVVTAEAESRQRVLAGKGESQRTLQIGLSEASVLMQKIQSYGDPRLYALALVAEHLAKSNQPLVPAHMFVAGGGAADASGSASPGQGLFGTLIGLLVAEKSGFKMESNGQTAAMKDLSEKMTKQVLDAMHNSGNVDLPPGKGEGVKARA